jgi:hypothetical protein
MKNHLSENLDDMDDAEVEEAKRLCRAEGMDAEFIGTKGYPNWAMFTPVARKETRLFLETIAAMQFGRE